MSQWTIWDGGECIYSPADDITLIDPVLTLEDNTSGTLMFEIADDNPEFTAVQTPITTIITVRRDDDIQWQGRVIESQQNFNLTWSVTCEGELAYLDDTIQPPRRFQNVTPIEYVRSVIVQHNAQVSPDKQFKLGIVTVVDSNDSIYRYTNFETTLTALREDILEPLGGHLRIRYEEDGRYLDILRDFPRTCSQSIEFGENLLDYSANYNAQDVATVIIPLGATLEEDEEDPATKVQGLDQRLTIESVNSGSRSLEIEEAVKRFGRITKVVTWDDVHVASILKSKAENWLQEAQWAEMVLELTAADLADFGLSEDSFHLLDSIVCSSAPHGMQGQFPLLKMQIHLADPGSNRYTLGSSQSTFTGSTSRAQAALEKSLKDAPKLSDMRKVAQEQATEIINATGKNGNLVHRPFELLIMDTNDIDTAQRIWRWNLGGFGYSQNGYEGPFETAITMDGSIVGTFISAHSITADKLDVAFTQSIDQKIVEAAATTLDDVDEKLLDYWTAGESETRLAAMESAINLSVNQSLSGYAANLAELRQDTSSQIALTTDAILQMVDKEQVIHSLNLLEGTQMWNRGIITGTKTVDGSVMKLSGSGELFELNQADIDIIPNSWYTLSAYISGSGSVKLQLSGLPYKIDADTAPVSTGSTEIDESMITVRQSADPGGLMKVSFRVSGQPSSEKSWIWDSFRFDVDRVEGNTTVVVCKGSSAGGPASIEKLQLERGREATPYNAGGNDLTRQTAEIRTVMDSITLAVASKVETSTYTSGLNSTLDTAKEYADTLVEEKAASIKITTDAIIQSVNSKVNESDFGTLIEQNSDSVMLAWTNSSKYLKFETGDINFYTRGSSSSSADIKRAKLTNEGLFLYKDTGEFSFELTTKRTQASYGNQQCDYQQANLYIMNTEYFQMRAGIYDMIRWYSEADLLPVYPFFPAHSLVLGSANTDFNTFVFGRKLMLCATDSVYTATDGTMKKDGVYYKARKNSFCANGSALTNFRVVNGLICDGDPVTYPF
ncbi:phage tail protein [Faecalibaculum rodentium]|uniref:phage tail protein n=1 Tax=Faecalibaculum rodentium TaxID=1702221 RepID=UPI0027302104|nr:phage tail protein [Faecalibaculum rodentium]